MSIPVTKAKKTGECFGNWNTKKSILKTYIYTIRQKLVNGPIILPHHLFDGSYALKAGMFISPTNGATQPRRAKAMEIPKKEIT